MSCLKSSFALKMQLITLVCLTYYSLYASCDGTLIYNLDIIFFLGTDDPRGFDNEGPLVLTS